MTSSVIQQTLRGLIAAVAIFVLNIGTMGFIAYKLTDANLLTVRTHQVIEELKDSLSSLQDVETSDRGYIITKNKSFLGPYNSGKISVYRHIENIEKLTQNDPDMKIDLDLLRKIVTEKIEFADDTIRDIDNGGGARLISSGKGKKIMDRYRERVGSAIEQQAQLLSKRADELRFVELCLYGAISLLTVCGGGILAWVFIITKTAMEEEKRRYGIVEDYNKKLENEIDVRKRTELALKETTVRLASSNADLQRFAYVASHDLQEPLRAISGFVTLLASKHKGQFDDESTTWVNFAVEGSQRMRNLINDLLSYARVESRGKTLEQMSSQKALDQAKKDLKLLIEESATNVIAGPLPDIRGDEGQISQVFQNLIANAIKFRAKNDPTVKIDVKETDENWLFSVHDNGIGFEEEHSDRIFIIFQRLHGREQYEGTGIGLALCKKIIERHGGRIWAESEPGRGSTFYFTIPKVQGETDEREIN